MRSKILTAALVVLLLGAGALYGWRGWAVRPPSPAALAERALAAASAQEKEQAATELARQGEAAVPHLRRVLGQSDVRQVRAVCLQHLGAAFDYESMPLVLAALDASSPLVRGRAEVAASRMLGRDYGLRAGMPEGQRRKLVALMRQEWDALKDSELLENFKKRLREQASTQDSRT